MKIIRSIKTMPALLLILLLSFTLGCGENFSPEAYGTPDEEYPSDQLQICSKLDFSQINWPTIFNAATQNSFALALNVTGSFEGSQSWTTIAGDSDGQGLSLGLLQQNLGSGTLQPLLATMNKSHKSKMQAFFSTSHWTSISAMLDEWTKTNPVTISSFALAAFQPLFPSDSVALSPLDENYDEPLFESLATTAVTKTLTWARQNILSNKVVKADWKKELQALSNSAEYRNYQFREALHLHLSTESYFKYFGFKTLTAYLFLYDVVVQNGGFNDSHKNLYQQYVKQNPNTNETQKLKKLLAIRLTSVRAQYRDDVNARKSTIINGTGIVHGSQRNLAKEYCFQNGLQISPL
ncbi:MAG: hypothetical protein AABZ31_01970 [Bdellovibrionota bacterium]